MKQRLNLGFYDIRFALDNRRADWRMPPAGACWREGPDKDIKECALVVPAYSAEDALTDLYVRLRSAGWSVDRICVQTVVPSRTGKAELPVESLPYYFPNER